MDYNCDFTTEIVQVDRRKLELLVQGISEDKMPSKNAEDFFNKIMVESGAEIYWPTRLKIGAKTKKDPHVKICGSPRTVLLAKQRILAELGVKKNRITLKVDISFSDHSHIIGIKGANTQAVMKQTGCHIHFPDSNRDPRYEKSNQVSIAGPMKNAERARSLLRGLAPVTLSFPTVLQHEGIEAILDNDPLVHQVRSMHMVDVLIRRGQSSGLWHILVRGNVVDEHQVKEATETLMHTHGDRKRPVVTATIEITQTHQPFVLGINGFNIKAIETSLGVKIRYPKYDEPADTTFYIQGLADTVLNARKYLISLLPLVMIFELKPEFKQLDLDRMGTETGLQISIKAKRQERDIVEYEKGCTIQNVIVKGPERLANTIFSMRDRFSVDGNGDVAAICTDYDFMANWDPANVPKALSSRYDHDHAAIQKQINPPPSAAAVQAGLRNMVISPAPGVLAPPPNMSVPPNSPASPAFQLSPVPVKAVGRALPSMSVQQQPGSVIASPRQSQMSVPESGYRSNESSLSGHDDPMRMDSTSPADQYMQNTELPPISPIEAPTSENRIAACIKDGAKRIQEQHHSKWKMVGRERQLHDYEENRVRAARAVNDKPTGIPRVVNPSFMGYFFSASTPQELLQHTFMELNHRNTLATHFEEEDEDKVGPWIIDKPKIIMNANATTYFDHGFPAVSLHQLISGDEDLPQLLMKLGLINYVETFAKQEVDVESFMSLTKEDFQSLGIKTGPHMTRMLLAVEHLKHIKGAPSF